MSQCFFDQPVTGWDATASEVRVQLQNETITAASLIITAGAWTSNLLRELQLPLAVKRKVIAWFDPLAPSFSRRIAYPSSPFQRISFMDSPACPAWASRLAEHTGGSYLPNADSPVSPRDQPTWTRLPPSLRNICPGLRATTARRVPACGIRRPASIP